MDTNSIIAAIDAELGRLQEARALLSGNSAATRAKKAPGVKKATRKRRKLSPEGRKRIAAAQRKRWAAAKAANKAAGKSGK